MLRFAVPIILLLLTLFAGAVWLDLGPGPRQPEQQAKEQQPGKTSPEASPAGDDVEQLKDALAPAPAGSGGAPAFDVARIDPNGTSVFAGRAEPRSSVTITADGKEIGTVEADDNGDWTFTTDTKIPNPDAKLALFKAVPRPKAQVAETPPAPPKPQTAGAVTANMLKNLEGMVAEARSGADKPAAAAVPTPPLQPPAENRIAAAAPAASVTPPSVTAPSVPASGVTAPPLQPVTPAVAPAAAPDRPANTSVPVPVTFVFNEATLTDEGRRAAALLLEYLQIKRFPKVTLTGHADERGTDALNMSLSRERLDTVASFLREGGFNGQLDLVPKGKTEPYLGVVRSEFPQEDLWQLDRRVELMVSR